MLLVEDEPGVRALARRALTGFGYRVLEATNGVEALTVARGTTEPIDLLLTDVVMPEMGGRELAQVLKQERRIEIKGDFLRAVFTEASRYARAVHIGLPGLGRHRARCGGIRRAVLAETVHAERSGGEGARGAGCGGEKQ